MKMLSNNQVLFEKVTAKYPRINQTYKYDNKEGRRIPCSPSDDGAEYTLDFEMNNKDAQQFLDKIEEVYKEAAKADTKREWKPKPLHIPYKEIDGICIGKSKKKGAYNGEATAKPRQVDSDTKELPQDFELTTGSTIDVFGKLFAYNTGANYGVGFRLTAVKVEELAERMESIPFEKSDGYKANAAPAQSNAAPAKPESNGEFFDDEIPF